MKVSLTMLLKTNVEKMSVLKSVTMLMKTSKLWHFDTMLMKRRNLAIGGRRSTFSFQLSTVDGTPVWSDFRTSLEPIGPIPGPIRSDHRTPDIGDTGATAWRPRRRRGLACPAAAGHWSLPFRPQGAEALSASSLLTAEAKAATSASGWRVISASFRRRYEWPAVSSRRAGQASMTAVSSAGSLRRT
jgi:hypothetical protein